jgi:ankyrin repeat protein
MVDAETITRLIKKIGDIEILKRLLNEAAKDGKLPILKELVRFGADPHSKNDLAMRWAAYRGQFDVVKYLIEECGADPHSGDNEALYWAVSKNHLDVVEYLEKFWNISNLKLKFF